MISSVIAASGFAFELPALKNRKIEFTPGLNILFGPNGCGKTSLLNIIKGYCGMLSNGWGTGKDIDQQCGAASKVHYPMALHNLTPGKCKAIIEWDGSPSFYNDGDIKVDEFSWFLNPKKGDDGDVITEADRMRYMAEKPSSGQYRIDIINKVLAAVKSQPNRLGHSFGEYVRSLPQNGKKTILLDEPERALSIPNQIRLFDLLQEVSKEYQIIMATHSPFVLFGMDANIVDFDMAYSEQCVNMLNELIARPRTVAK